MKNFLLYRGQMYINTLKLLHLSKTDSWGQKNFPEKICMSFLESQKKVGLLVTEILTYLIVISGICVQYGHRSTMSMYKYRPHKNNSYIFCSRNLFR